MRAADRDEDQRIGLLVDDRMELIRELHLPTSSPLGATRSTPRNPAARATLLPRLLYRIACEDRGAISRPRRTRLPPVESRAVVRSGRVRSRPARSLHATASRR